MIPIQTSVQGMIKRLLNDKIIIFHGFGPPVNGAAPMGTGAGVTGPGSIYIDVTNRDLWINGGTVAVPVWSSLANATVLAAGLSAPLASAKVPHKEPVKAAKDPEKEPIKEPVKEPKEPVTAAFPVKEPEKVEQKDDKK